MPARPRNQSNDKPNELSEFLGNLDEETRKLLITCLHLNGELGDSLTEKQKLEKIRSAL